MALFYLFHDISFQKRIFRANFIMISDFLFVLHQFAFSLFHFSGKLFTSQVMWKSVKWCHHVNHFFLRFLLYWVNLWKKLFIIYWILIFIIILILYCAISVKIFSVLNFFMTKLKSVAIFISNFFKLKIHKNVTINSYCYNMSHIIWLYHTFKYLKKQEKSFVSIIILEHFILF